VLTLDLIGAIALVIALSNHTVARPTTPARAGSQPAITVAPSPLASNTKTSSPKPASSRVPASLPPASASSNGSFTPSPTASSVLRLGARASFASLRASLPGPVDVSIAPLGRGGTVTLGGDAPAHGWSTTKVPVLVALFDARQNRGLTPAEQGWAQLAITQSDNQSVLNLFGDLETLAGGPAGASRYIQAILQKSGDAQTVVATAPPPPGAVTTFGQTEWTPSDAVKFFRALAIGCLLPGSESSYVLGLMEHVAPSESWGLGSAGFGVPVAFKGGWGPEQTGGYLVRQSGIIDPLSSRGVAVSIVAYPPAGGSSFGIGTAMLTKTAQWLRSELLLRSRPSGSNCSGP
jgi:hypothetical protein